MRKVLVLVGALVFAVAAVGCGSSGASSGSEGAGGDTTTEAKTTTTTGGGTASGSDDEYLAAIADHLTKGSDENLDLVVSATEGDCVAPIWLDTITTKGFEDSGVSPDDMADPGFDLSELDLTSAEAQALIDGFGTCKVDIFSKLAESFTMGLTDEQQACAMEKVDPKVANALLVTAFSTDSGDGTAEFNALLDQLTEACDLPASGGGAGG